MSKISLYACTIRKGGSVFDLSVYEEMNHKQMTIKRRGADSSVTVIQSRGRNCPKWPHVWVSNGYGRMMSAGEILTDWGKIKPSSLLCYC